MVKTGCVKWSMPYTWKKYTNQWFLQLHVSATIKMYTVWLAPSLLPKRTDKIYQKFEDHVTSLCKMATVSAQTYFYFKQILRNRDKENWTCRWLPQSLKGQFLCNSAAPGYLGYLQLFPKINQTFVFIPFKKRRRFDTPFCSKNKKI